MEARIKDRPNWKDIFFPKKLWFLSLNEYLKNKSELQMIKAKIESTEYLENVFYLLFIDTKLFPPSIKTEDES